MTFPTSNDQANAYKSEKLVLDRHGVNSIIRG